VGGGPAGLYFSVLAKQADPGRRVRVFERNRPDDTFGFGVVFSENTMGFLSEQDQRNYPEIMAASRRWNPITVVHRGEVVRCGGVGFSAIERKRLLNILHGQAVALGVELEFETEISSLSRLGEADLIVLADGVNSVHRDAEATAFGTAVDCGPTRFTWLGTTRSFDSLTFFFERSEDGVFGAHVYPYGDDRSTFIVETDAATWLRAGMDGFSEDDTIAYCERLFAKHLDGHRLLSNRSLWAPFRTVHNRRWHSGNRVLVGDAAHTAHFSVGSGTRMAMEDGLALAQQLQRLQDDVAAATAAFEAERRPRVERIQRMARASFDWWESFRHYVDWPPHRFAFHFLTRSQFRYDTLKERDPGFLRRVEEEAGGPVLAARTVSTRPSDDTAWLLLGTAAVSLSGRVAPTDRLVRDCRTDLERERGRGGRRRIGLRLNHAGPRGACRHWGAGLDDPLRPEEAWPLVAASPLAYAPNGAVPTPLDRTGMEEVVRDFRTSTADAAAAGFDWLELQFGHGFLISTFLSPVTNARTDEFGGAVENRLRFPLRVLEAARSAWPRDRMLAAAISADHDGGVTYTDIETVARALRSAGCDVVTVDSGQTTWRSTPAYGRAFNMLTSGRLRNEAGVATMCTGGITGHDDVKTVLLSNRADYVRLDAVRRVPTT
jgi:anthraniloyl-CoA monooxygenase